MNIKRQSEHLGLRPDKSSLVLIITEFLLIQICNTTLEEFTSSIRIADLVVLLAY